MKSKDNHDEEEVDPDLRVTPLTPERLKADLEAAFEDIRAGRVHAWEEVRKEMQEQDEAEHSLAYLTLERLKEDLEKAAEDFRAGRVYKREEMLRCLEEEWVIKTPPSMEIHGWMHHPENRE